MSKDLLKLFRQVAIGENGGLSVRHVTRRHVVQDRQLHVQLPRDVDGLQKLPGGVDEQRVVDVGEQSRIQGFVADGSAAGADLEELEGNSKNLSHEKASTNKKPCGLVERRIKK